MGITSGGGLTGQQTSAASDSIVIASDQDPIAITSAVSTDTTIINGDGQQFLFDVTGLATLTVVITGTYGGTIYFNATSSPGGPGGFNGGLNVALGDGFARLDNRTGNVDPDGQGTWKFDVNGFETFQIDSSGVDSNPSTIILSASSIGGSVFSGSTSPLIVTVPALPLPSGAATEAKQDSELIYLDSIATYTQGTSTNTSAAAVSLTSIDNHIPAGLAVISNQLRVDGSGVTQPVSAASLPLPTGAATLAAQTQPGVDIGDVTINNAGGGASVNIQDGGNSITVDGTITASIAAAQTLGTVTTVGTVNTVTTVTNVASLTSITNAVAVTDNSGSLTVDNNGTFAVQATIAASATNIAKAEDSASANADVGVPAMAIQLASPTDLAGTDADYAILQMSGGRLWTSTKIDTALPAGSAVIGHVINDASSAVIGHVISDSGSTTAVTGNVASTVADGADVTLGAKADAKSTATDTTAVSVMSVLKQISASSQAPPSSAVTNAGTFAVQATLQASTGVDIGKLTANQSVNTAQVNGGTTVASVTGVQDVMPRKRTGATGLSPNYYATRITSKATTTPTAATAYVSVITFACSAAGTAWTFVVQNKEATPKILVPSITLTVPTTGAVIMQFNEPVLMTSGIDIVTGGTTAGTVDVFITYWQ